MVRITKEYDARYTEFLDVAQGLFFSKGYEQTSIQEIIAAVKVAKGTFYYYFESKVDLLSELIKRMVGEVALELSTICADERLDAAAKLGLLVRHTNRLTVERKQVMLQTIRLLARDENALLREKMQAESTEVFVPILAAIIRQGIAEGVFEVAHADETAELLLTMPQRLSQTVAHAISSGGPDDSIRAKIARQIATLNASMARVLGMGPNALVILDDTYMAAWMEMENRE